MDGALQLKYEYLKELTVRRLQVEDEIERLSAELRSNVEEELRENRESRPALGSAFVSVRRDGAVKEGMGREE